MTETKNSVWIDDKLDRQSSAKYLTEYLNAKFAEDDQENDIYKSSYVLNVNSGWGFGKTFFIKKWFEQLKIEGHPALYFDAWKNDFADDPLLAFISELEEGLEPYFKNIPLGPKVWKETMKAAKNVIAPTSALALNLAATALSGGVIPDLTSRQQDNIVKNLIKNYKNKKSAINEFKEKLRSLVNTLKATSKSKLPIYIFIDELDRCRPTYALALLEAIKHIFGVGGFYFVVATNKNELSHSVKAVYGTEFDALTYLRRFFDQEYVLPKPDNNKFSIYLTEKLRIASSTDLYTPVVRKNNEAINPIAKTFSLLATSFDLSLRDQEQVGAQLKAILLTNKNKTIHSVYLIFLMMLKQKNEASLELFINSRETGFDYRDTVSQNIQFDGMIPRDYGATPGLIKLVDILEIYRKNAYKNSTKLHEYQFAHGTIGEVISKLKEEAPNSFNPDTYYPLSISNYPEMVKQAGHLLF